MHACMVKDIIGTSGSIIVTENTGLSEFMTWYGDDSGVNTHITNLLRNVHYELQVTESLDLNREVSGMRIQDALSFLGLEVHDYSVDDGEPLIPRQAD